MNIIWQDTIKEIFSPTTDRLNACFNYINKKAEEKQKTGFQEFIEIIKGQAIKIPVTHLCGIYFLWKDYSVVYVGQSINIYGRVATHIKEGSKKFDYACALYCEKEKLDLLESAFIGLLKPKYNWSNGVGEFFCQDKMAFNNYEEVLGKLEKDKKR